MEKLKLLLAIGAFIIFASVSILAFLFALNDIFGKSFNWKSAAIAITTLWVVIGLYTLAERFIEKRNNPRNQ